MTGNTDTLEVPARLGHIRGLRDYWARHTFRSDAPTPRAQTDRMLLDTLGLGLEQALTWLARERPGYGAFEDWILATAGAPDPVAVARYHAWLDGVPPPPQVQARLAAIDAMAPVLDAADLAQWERDGYVILREAISRDEAAAIADLLWALVDADPDAPASWYGPRTNGIMIQHFQHPAMDVPRRSMRVHKAFAQLWGTADLWALVDRLSFNPPERPGTRFPGPHLHWDASLAPPIPFATQGILYLTDTVAEQGAFQLVPGMHHGLADWLEGLDGRNPREEPLDHRAVPIAAGAGDLIIWRQDLPHGATPNRAARPRMAQYVTMYAPDLEPNPQWL